MWKIKSVVFHVTDAEGMLNCLVYWGNSVV